MKEKKHIHSILTLLPSLGLVMLLLLSPCKVRNSIQEALGLVKTEVSNKSITSLTSSNCETLQEINSLNETYSPTKKNASLLPINRIGFSSVTAISSQKESINYNKGRASSPSVPFYILYQNIKAYL